MMDEATRQGLDIAINEATLLGVEVDRDRRLAAVTLAVLTLPEGGGGAPEDRRVSLVLSPVGQVVASLRNGTWDDRSAEIVPFDLRDLLDIVRSFRQQDLYGWEFIDCAEDFKTELEQLSLKEDFAPDGRSHSLRLFQEDGSERHLEVRIGFDELRVFKADGAGIPVEEFIASGKRWWDAFFAGDKRTDGLGMFPA